MYNVSVNKLKSFIRQYVRVRHSGINAFEANAKTENKLEHKKQMVNPWHSYEWEQKKNTS